MTDVSPFVDRPVKPANTPPSWLRKLVANEELNFLLTNRIPRHALTVAMGRISRIRNPLLTRAALWLWRRFTDLDLSEAEHTRFESIHACFTRRLKPGARPIDTRSGILCSPSDAIVGASGMIDGDSVLQAKGMPYRLADLFGPSQDHSVFHGGTYVTLRLTSSMYHRFHAPDDLALDHVTYISGDTWNVNPPALKRISSLYCRNERAVLRARLSSDGTPVALIPVAAVLVASMRLHALDVLLHLQYRGPNEMPVNAPYARGAEMGWFEHGSTIIVVVPSGFSLHPDVQMGATVRMGQALLQRNPHAS